MSRVQGDFVRLLATLCCASFFGAALYISLVQHPAALEAGNEIYLRYFPAMYRRAAVLQGGAAALGFLAGIVAWRTSHNRLWLAAAILLGSAIPLTILVIGPVNDALMSQDPSRRADVGALLARWGRLHLIRTIASGTALLCCLVSLLRRPPSSDSETTRTHGWPPSLRRRGKRGGPGRGQPNATRAPDDAAAPPLLDRSPMRLYEAPLGLTGTQFSILVAVQRRGPAATER